MFHTGDAALPFYISIGINAAWYTNALRNKNKFTRPERLMYFTDSYSNRVYPRIEINKSPRFGHGNSANVFYLDGHADSRARFSFSLTDTFTPFWNEVPAAPASWNGPD